jgi:hypothetical protein
MGAAVPTYNHPRCPFSLRPLLYLQCLISIMLLVTLAERVYHLFAQDNTSPRHDNINVSIYSYSDYAYFAYSTKDGYIDESPFAGTREGVFAVINSSIMPHVLEWPALT